MFSKNETPMIATETTNVMSELFKLFFLGKYTDSDYEYVFYLNGEELKADDCYSNFYGSTYCMLNDVKYNNVEYARILVNEYEKTNPVIPVFTCGILLILILKLVFKLFFDFGSGDFIDV